MEETINYNDLMPAILSDLDLGARVWYKDPLDEAHSEWRYITRFAGTKDGLGWARKDQYGKLPIKTTWMFDISTLWVKKDIIWDKFDWGLAISLPEIDILVKRYTQLVQITIKEQKEKRRTARVSEEIPIRLQKAQNRLKILENEKKQWERSPFTKKVLTCINEISWDAITFHDHYINVRPTAGSFSLKIPVSASKASFNFIKKAIASRLEPISIEWNLKAAIINNPIYFTEVISYMGCKENLSNIFANDSYEYRKYYDSIPSKLSRLFFPKSKTEYLDFLSEAHSPAYKIVPVQETLNNIVEDSFLFTVERGRAMYIVWENTNLSRATYVFRVDPVGYEDRLQFVFDYIVSNVRAKRQRLHSDNIDKEMFGDFEIINHTEIGTWRLRLDHLFAKENNQS